MMLPLHGVTPGLASALGLPGPLPHDFAGPADHVVLILIDGLGWLSLREHADLAPNIAWGPGADAWQAEVPTTTPAGLAALGTGLHPGASGFVGASFYLPETDNILTPLHWPEGTPPVMVQSETTVFESMERENIAVTSIGPGAYANSGLTQAVFRGGKYLAAHDPHSYADALLTAQTNSRKSFTYAYWPDLDRAGHRYGVNSEQWRESLRTVDALVSSIIRVSQPGTLMVLTADHGMLDVTEADQVALDEVHSLRGHISHTAGEPRFRHVYLNIPGEDVVESVRNELGFGFDVFTRNSIEDEGIFGPLAPGIEDRIGDLVCIARDRWVLTSNVDPRVSSFIGQHGARTPHELLIPGIVGRV
jgi:hypothetical protein